MKQKELKIYLKRGNETIHEFHNEVQTNKVADVIENIKLYDAFLLNEKDEVIGTRKSNWVIIDVVRKGPKNSIHYVIQCQIDNNVQVVQKSYFKNKIPQCQKCFLNEDLGMVKGDWEVVDVFLKQYQRQYKRVYKIRCMICGYEKAIRGDEFKDQTKHHICPACIEKEALNEIGTIKDNWEVIDRYHKTVNNSIYLAYRIRCLICGYEKEIRRYEFIDTNQYHICDNCRKIELDSFIGKTIGRLKVISYIRKDGIDYFNCVCSCERHKKVMIKYSDLKKNNNPSCGCINIERLTKHGYSKLRIFKEYKGMIRRCYNSKFKGYNRYGGRGIIVCDKWLGKEGFENFRDWAYVNGYTDKLTLDRIYNDGIYSPENCRWVISKVQNNNTSGCKQIYIRNNKTNIIGYFNTIQEGIDYISRGRPKLKKDKEHTTRDKLYSIGYNNLPYIRTSYQNPIFLRKAIIIHQLGELINPIKFIQPGELINPIRFVNKI